MARRPRVPGCRVLAAAVPLALVVGACGDDGDDAEPDAPAEDREEDVDEGAADAADVLRIHVSNDDGVDAPGLDAVVEALHTLDDVEIIVISPLEDQSGSSDRVSDDLPDATEEQTLSGRDAIAVHGTPADSVVWAHQEHFVDDVDPPHLTVSGSNGGQNVGELAYISGTVGVVREAARQGVPGLAVSQQFGEQIGDYDLPYETVTPLMLDWIEDHRAALLAGEMGLDTVASLNGPTCSEGEPRGLFETELDLRSQDEGGPSLFAPSDCTSTAEPEGLHDVEAMQIGFVTLTEVPVEEPA